MPNGRVFPMILCIRKELREGFFTARSIAFLRFSFFAVEIPLFYMTA